MNKYKQMVAVSALALMATTTSLHAEELRIGFARDADTLDPGNHRNRETETIIRNMYDGILTRDSSMVIHPEIAESYNQVSATEYDFVIRDGIKFHDGSELTVEDVKFTLERLFEKDGMGDGQTSPRQSLLGPMESIEILNSNTLRVHLSEPWPLLPAMLPFQEIVSKDFVEQVGTEGMASQVNGTGPFELVRWNRGESIVMERFDDYYGGAEGISPTDVACVERAIFRVIPESSSRVAALLAGDVHIISELPTFSVNQVRNNADTDVMAVNGTRSFFIAMNNESDLFSDIRVRKALAHALDKDLIVDRILDGFATPIDGILSPEAFGKNKELPTFEYDPSKARQLLADAGYPNGIEVTLDVEGAYRDTAEAIGSVLSKSGITTNVSVSEAAILTQKWRTEGEEKSGDLYMTSWGNGSLDPHGIFVPTHRTNDRGNSAGYANPAVDDLLDRASVEVDTNKRAEMYQQAEAIAASDVPYIYLWVPQDLYGVSNRLSGWSPSPDSRINLHDACLN
jgi:peptide/nickel transport system substrate-binding protein